jgi:hypothetical protein
VRGSRFINALEKRALMKFLHACTEEADAQPHAGATEPSIAELLKSKVRPLPHLRRVWLTRPQLCAGAGACIVPHCTGMPARTSAHALHRQADALDAISHRRAQSLTLAHARDRIWLASRGCRRSCKTSCCTR